MTASISAASSARRASSCDSARSVRVGTGRGGLELRGGDGGLLRKRRNACGTAFSRDNRQVVIGRGAR